MILYNPTVSGSLLITGSLTTTGILTAQTLVVQTITSSVDFVTGSSVNGSLSSNTHQFTGSVLVSGSVGIGTSSPSQKLHISDSTAVYCRIVNTTGADVYLGAENTIGVLSVSNNNSLDIRTNNITRMYITASGNIGIGVTSPVVPLQVGSGSVGSIPGWMKVMTSDATQSGIGSVYNNKAIYLYNNGSSIKLDAYDYSASAALNIQIGGNGGNVGIGIVPSTGWSQFTTLQLGGNTYSALASSNAYLNIAANSYYDGTNFRYISTNYTSRYQMSDGTHLWYVAPSGTAGNAISYSTAMIITNEGKVGIGTTTIGTDFRLAVYGTNSLMAFQNANTGQTNGDGFIVGSFGNVDAYLFNYENANIIFGTNAAERMRITSNGDVRIGAQNSTVTTRLAISYDNAYPGDVQPSHLSLCGVTDSRKRLSLGYDTTNNYGWINSGQWGVTWTDLKLNPSSGAVYAGSVRLDTLSDFRVKDNIQPILGSLDKILQLNGKKFHLKDEPEGKIRYGFIAQDLEGVLDEFVINSDMIFKKDDLVVENVKSIENWASSWAALLVEAIKEQQSQIEGLKAEIDTLKQQQ